MRAISLSLLVAAAACGGGDDALSPQEGCERIAEVYCDRVYECFTEAERNAVGFPPTEAGCVTQAEERAGCANVTVDNFCAGGETYHGDKVSACAEKALATECSMIRDPNYDADEDLPECDAVCE